ncbi:hypothetical protein BC940DRAFT_295501 [Gongronella butleri]|nr:hypothetical protein BC940DRAFT_295501 [Gongronella butleri]
MADNVRHSQLNANVLPSSAEELAQKYQSLFQDYSKLKAQHTILKKAVKKERSENTILQGNVKDKEKELRKLQGQLDILTFHSERLSKRIEAVQDLDTKGSHFSLLGGTIKKELEKSNQALDAANVDLAKKIEENEELHAELAEINHIYTDNLNGLYQQISKLEKQVEELQVERSLLQSETSASTALVKEKDELAARVQELEDNLIESSNSQAVDENQHAQMLQNQESLQDEINALRALLFAKMGPLDTESEATNVAVASQAQEHLHDMKQMTSQYIASLGDKSSVPNVPQEVLAKLQLKGDSWADEMKQLTAQLNNYTEQVTSLQAKQEQDTQTIEALTTLSKELEETIASLEHEQASAQAEHNTMAQSANARIEQLETEVKSLYKVNAALKHANEELSATRDTLIKDNASFRIDITAKADQLANDLDAKKKALDDMEDTCAQLSKTNDAQASEISSLREQLASRAANVPVTNGASAAAQDVVDEDDESDTFVYPVPNEQPAPSTQEEQPKEKADSPAPAQVNGNGSSSSEIDVDAIVAEREAKLKQYYEAQVDQLMDKLQLVDSKVARYAGIAEALQEQLAKEAEDKKALHEQIQKLKDDNAKLEENISTTEANYQRQLDVMTEYTTSLQDQLVRQQAQ